MLNYNNQINNMNKYNMMNMIIHIPVNLLDKYNINNNNNNGINQTIINKKDKFYMILIQELLLIMIQLGIKNKIYKQKNLYRKK